MASLQLISSNKTFGGLVLKYKHNSFILNCDINFSVFLPESVIDPNADPETVVSKTSSKRVPAIVYLAGLTCNEDTFFFKGGPFRAAAANNVALIAPDTSPRGLNVPGEDDDWDFGSGAGFYLDATEEKWKNYRMKSYITKELYSLVIDSLPINSDKISIFGHSMGGHGALTLGLTYPELFKSISAFAPIANPINVPWGIKAFTGYLGDSDKSKWEQYDASILMKKYNGEKRFILIDQGTDDKFLENNLKPESLKNISNEKIDLNLRYQKGYDHSYYFISTFIEDHINFHSKHLSS